MQIGRRFFALLALGSLIFCYPLFASAVDVSVSAIVHEIIPPEPTPATVTFEGFAYPGAHVRILKDGTEVGSTTAAANASYSVQIQSQPGSYSFGVVATDTAGTTGALFTIALALTEAQTVSVSDVVLGPTISESHTSVEQGQSITFSGYATPNSSVTVTVNSEQTLTLAATTNSSGFWTESVSTSSLDPGSHTAKAKSTFGALVSEFSNTLSFIVTGKVVNICDGKANADINCDGSVDLVDFSILLYYWDVTNPANSRADINGDNHVDETDFSILLSEWTG